jgi:hypothetical protein
MRNKEQKEHPISSKRAIRVWVAVDGDVADELRKSCGEHGQDLAGELKAAIHRQIRFRAASARQARKRREERDLHPLGFFSSTLEEQTELEIEHLEEQERERQFDAGFLKHFRITDDGFDAQI